MSVIVTVISPRSCGIGRLKLVHFDNLFVRHQLHESAMVRIGVRSRLAGPGRRIVRERNPD
jgi:hypothetical protein